MASNNFNNNQISSAPIIFATISPNWQVQGVGDFNGDGRSDVLWRNNNNGQIAAWLINNNQIGSAPTFVTVSPNWQVQGVGDFNGDGRSDVLWRNNNNGQIAAWLINEDRPQLPTRLIDWEKNMLFFGRQVAERIDALDPAIPPIEKLDALIHPAGRGGYYDGASVFAQIADYTGDLSWHEYSEKVNDIYIDFVKAYTPSASVQGFNNFSDGLESQYFRINDSKARDTIAILATSAAYTTFAPISENLKNPDRSREVAYGINTLISAERTGLFAETDSYYQTLYEAFPNPKPDGIVRYILFEANSSEKDTIGSKAKDRLSELVNFSFAHLESWFANEGHFESDNLSPIQPFMVGLTAKSLIEYVEHTPEGTDDTRLQDILGDGLRQMWDSAWVAKDSAFSQSYQPGVVLPNNIQGEPDLDLLISPAYQWVYQETGDTWFRDRADEIFSGGVQGAFLGGNKQFFQNYFWSFEHVESNFFQTQGVADL